MTRLRPRPSRSKSASFPPAGEVFIFDGSSRVCPVCHVFIRKGISPVVRLPRPMKVRVRRIGCCSCVSSVTGKPFYYDGHCPPSPERPRWFVHERCWGKIQRAIEREAQR